MNAPQALRGRRLLSAWLLVLLAALAAPVSAQPDDPGNTSGRSIAAPAGGIVTSAHPLATEAGRSILAKGGSAADAAIAMMLALTVVEPQSSGIGGGGFLVHHDAGQGLIDSIDGRETAPAAARPDRFLGADGKPIGFRDAAPGGLSVGVPGNVRLAADAHRRWGRLPWGDLFAPAIALAENGYPVSAPMAQWLDRLKPLWKAFPQARAIYWDGDAPKQAGETVTNPELAALLREIAAQGPDAFYSGATAEAISAAVAGSARNPAAITAADLAGYEARPRPALCTRYRRWKICGMGPPSSGGVTVQQILGMLERFDLAALGPDSPRAWHLLAEAMRLAYADRDAYLGDPDFVAVPVAGLVDPAYLARRSALIDPARARGRYPAGNPPAGEARTAGASGEAHGTTHFVAVDGGGNIASMTSTVEGPFGSQLIARGMVLNNELTDFTFVPEADGAPVANRVEPGKRPLSSMAPTIVYDEQDQPVLALGSAGGKRIIMHVAKTLVAHLDFGLPIDRAIAQPNIYFGGDGLLVEQGTPLAAMAGEIAAFGHTVVATDLPSKINAAALVGGRWQGAADPRGIGNVLVP